MSGPGVMRLYDRDEEPAPPTETSGLVRQLPSGVGTVRADRGGNILAVDLDPRVMQRVSAEVLTAQLTDAIQQVQRHAVAAQQQPQRQRNPRRG